MLNVIDSLFKKTITVLRVFVYYYNFCCILSSDRSDKNTLTSERTQGFNALFHYVRAGTWTINA